MYQWSVILYELPPTFTSDKQIMAGKNQHAHTVYTAVIIKGFVRIHIIFLQKLDMDCHFLNYS